ncbi:hypothetical protein B0H15DRAFT_945251 [Mycena belliarum]|uniref:Uncharacterized protein n=1 Tax=Mycena belliarum TaxID=1033014 RepID=A0AAD6UCW5_9AGAR|nr:hypothetical protein B0H15DRAFT_945251 [Mycena belliae]
MSTLFLTRTTLMVLHPRQVVRRHCIWRDGSARPSTEFTIAAERVGGMGGVSTAADLLHAQAAECGALLRRLRGGQGVGLLRWNALPLDQVATDAYASFMDDVYSIGWTWARCKDATCPMFGFPRDVVASVPSALVCSQNPKEQKLLRRAHTITHALPSFPSLVRGVLYPTSCATPILVPVALDYGVPRYRTIDDLRGYDWIYGRTTGTRRPPIFSKPHLAVGSACIFEALGWRRRWQVTATTALLVFMASIDGAGPRNNLVPDNRGPAVHGDLLLVFEVNGEVHDALQGDCGQMLCDFIKMWETRQDGEQLGTAPTSRF